MSFNPIRSITLSNVFRVLGITLAICLVFGIVDSGVSWAGTPVVRNIPTTNSSAHSFLISLAVNPTTDTVYAANGHSISVISGKTDKVTHTILAKSAGLAVNPTTDTVYAANGHSISVISGATSKLVRSIRARSNVVGFSVNPTTDTVYATNRNSVSVIALATGNQTSDSRVIIGLPAVGFVIVVGEATFLVALKRRRAA
ncbi:YncE family protein [Ferrimicrobium acidiphilum]|uniref:YncE family protein n=1 Tax=Ferrimicrobium acidiphilum DSM 19497 TaxID=1121877 RepID=A0A0D8FQV7_9ACTN|nr:hypothetical protein [Ferrimicrobium acidiphilum]KJE75663.1 hypothetical protein FEAC_26230 [Ferrimicrobium acidiphilum DSM 19497]